MSKCNVCDRDLDKEVHAKYCPSLYDYNIYKHYTINGREVYLMDKDIIILKKKDNLVIRFIKEPSIVSLEFTELQLNDFLMQINRVRSQSPDPIYE